VRGKGNKLGEEEGEPCPKVRLSQDRLPIEQAYFAQMSFMKMSLRANVTQPKKPVCIKTFFPDFCALKIILFIEGI
jgi:hypothetical protein